MALRVEWISQLQQVSISRWNALCADDNPFLRHEFLESLESSGSLRADLGWKARHLLLWRDDRLIGASPCYQKMNSHGEFVFDFRWADAWERAGGRYYPKLLSAIPYSPVTGSRLLVAEHEDAVMVRAQLRDAMTQHCSDHEWSSAHINFLTAAEHAELRPDDEMWLARSDWQYHWRHQGYASFDEFLAALSAKKRKNIRQERARFTSDEWKIERLVGAAITPDVMADVYRFYSSTFQMKGNHPALTPEFFDRLLQLMPESVMIVLATWRGTRVAASWFMQGGGRLYGRYWGSSVAVSGLHFECCYYQGIEHCIAEGLQVFEPGAQGEHKIARGFLPTQTFSRHYIADAGFRIAIADYLRREAEHQQRYGEMLLTHSPYRDQGE